MTHARISLLLNRARTARGHTVALQGHTDQEGDRHIVAIEIALESIIQQLKAERAALEVEDETGAPLMISGGA